MAFLPPISQCCPASRPQSPLLEPQLAQPGHDDDKIQGFVSDSAAYHGAARPLSGLHRCHQGARRAGGRGVSHGRPGGPHRGCARAIFAACVKVNQVHADVQVLVTASTDLVDRLQGPRVKLAHKHKKAEASKIDSVHAQIETMDWEIENGR